MALTFSLRPGLRPTAAGFDQRLAILEGVGERAVGHAGQIDHAFHVAARVRVVEESRLDSAACLTHVRVMAETGAAGSVADREIVAVAQSHTKRAVGAALHEW